MRRISSLIARISMDGLGSCSRPRGGRRGSKEARENRDKNLNLVDVYDIAADIGKVIKSQIEMIWIFLFILYKLKI